MEPPWVLRFTWASVVADVLIAMVGGFVRAYFTRMCGYSPETQLLRTCTQPFIVLLGVGLGIAAAAHLVITLIFFIAMRIQKMKS